MPDDKPSRTLAILLGASRFPYAPNLAYGRPFSNSASDLEEYLLDEHGLALARRDVLWLFDDSRSPSDQLDVVIEFLRRTQELKSEDPRPKDLLFYYVGHGLFNRGDQAYCLAVRSTRENNEGATSIRASDLAAVLRDNAAFLRRYLILDCCFSASIHKEFQSGALTAARVQIEKELPPGRGTALLCSSSGSEASLAPQGLGHTMFSSALLQALRNGHEARGPRLSFSDLRYLVIESLRHSHPDDYVRPEVHSPDQREGDIADFPLFPNPAFRKSAIQQLVREHKRQRQAPAESARQKVEEKDRIRAEEALAGEKAEAKEGAEAERRAREKAEQKTLARKEAEKQQAREEAELERVEREKAEQERDTWLMHVNRGNVLKKKGDVRAAMVEYHEAIRLDRQNDVPRILLAEALDGIGKLDEAITECQQALRLRPDSVEAHYRLGLFLYEKYYVDNTRKDLSNAIAEYLEALRLNPKYAPAHHDLAEALQKKGDAAGALEHLRIALELEPKNSTFRSDYQKLMKAETNRAKEELEAEERRIQKERELAKKKAEADRLQRENVEANRLAAETAEAERKKREKAERDRLARENAAPDSLAAAKASTELRQQDAPEKVSWKPIDTIWAVILVAAFAGGCWYLGSSGHWLAAVCVGFVGIGWVLALILEK